MPETSSTVKGEAPMPNIHIGYLASILPTRALKYLEADDWGIKCAFSNGRQAFRQGQITCG